MFIRTIIPIIATTISSHLISGSLAMVTVTRQYKKTQRNQYLMTFLAISISLLQTFFILNKIKRVN